MSNRPLSPHLQIYDLPITAKLSILHRATGAFLLAGLFIMVMVLVAIEVVFCVVFLAKNEHFPSDFGSNQEIRKDRSYLACLSLLKRCLEIILAWFLVQTQTLR